MRPAARPPQPRGGPSGEGMRPGSRECERSPGARIVRGARRSAVHDDAWTPLRGDVLGRRGSRRDQPGRVPPRDASHRGSALAMRGPVSRRARPADTVRGHAPGPPSCDRRWRRARRGAESAVARSAALRGMHAGNGRTVLEPCGSSRAGSGAEPRAGGAIAWTVWRARARAGPNPPLARIVRQAARDPRERRTTRRKSCVVRGPWAHERARPGYARHVPA